MTSLKSRRPRFERVEMRSIVLTPRDLALLRAVHRYRFLRSTHLVALAGGSAQGALRRLQLLFHHGYLDRPPVQVDWYSRGSAALVYTLAKAGAAALGVNPGRQPSPRWGAKDRAVTRPYLDHALEVADVMVAFELACRRSAGARLIHPEEIVAHAADSTRRLSKPLQWSVSAEWNGERGRIAVAPDYVFGLAFDALPEARRRQFFFLEADRGTMPVARRRLSQSSFLKKLVGYRETWHQGVHRRLLGLSNFRVLTVTASSKRVGHLVAACRAVAPALPGLFLFRERTGIDWNSILRAIWINGKGKRTRFLGD